MARAMLLRESVIHALIGKGKKGRQALREPALSGTFICLCTLFFFFFFLYTCIQVKFVLSREDDD